MLHNQPSSGAPCWKLALQWPSLAGEESRGPISDSYTLEVALDPYFSQLRPFGFEAMRQWGFFKLLLVRVDGWWEGNRGCWLVGELEKIPCGSSCLRYSHYLVPIPLLYLFNLPLSLTTPQGMERKSQRGWFWKCIIEELPFHGFVHPWKPSTPKMGVLMVCNPTLVWKELKRPCLSLASGNVVCRHKCTGAYAHLGATVLVVFW